MQRKVSLCSKKAKIFLEGSLCRVLQLLGVKERDHFKFGAGVSSYFFYLGIPGCGVHALRINQPKG